MSVAAQEWPDVREPIERVGVIGCGLMGSGIAEVAALADCQVTVVASRPASAQAGLERVLASLERRVAKGRITGQQRDAARRRLVFTTDLEDMADRQIVVESVREHEDLKVELFGALDRIVKDPDAILATNTSSLPITRIGRATTRPGQVIGTHFFSPVPAMPLVELICSLETAEPVYERARHFTEQVLGKKVIRSADRSGFVVNALLIPFLLSAMRMVESGFATPEVIDQGMVLGCAHPVGPLKLADLVGLDTVADVGAALYQEFKEPLYAPPPLLLRMVEAGRHGRKTGRGFYEYDT
ncbi:3-hydroxybutyryl-CoA dehydrogenase [Streptomyces sp. DvalAA-14]|uniref:3-hydroxybutyryl-CoA dehydrogenase n=1 Tax=unclassified Streptomyces TaxID=2593676 RepID=UPI00081BA0B2|nr:MULTISPECIES: 3-hydroxybutyryl-CoA dehydrogenase [unclassified Streptomyces]MYS24429.1 3-hydroxybutyryl-CoA dehydrogenase [Streptomyces sp. SID4948]SCE45931.1 3-hydroxybutyryl-CoA dehydrogenase [Streptomyces sp. DvalAA-14]